MSVPGYPGEYTAHVDTFARDNLPPPELWPLLTFDRPEYVYPERINCGVVLCDDAVREGHGDRVAIYLPMIPEAVASMLAVARVGAIHCPTPGMAAPAFFTRPYRKSKPGTILAKAAVGSVMASPGRDCCGGCRAW